MFVHEGEKNDPIASMPGVYRLNWRNGLIDTVREARSYGVNQVVIFPKVSACAGFVRVAMGVLNTTSGLCGLRTITQCMSLL